MESLVGQIVGRYQILGEIGRGGMGVVYRALDTTLNREVALKVLPPEVVSDPDRRRRFLREAQTASQLEHAHIGVIHEVGEADGVSFIAMELVRGESLASLIGRHALTPSRALELAAEIAEGLARAHDQGVIHRDLKPANVMVTDDGHAKIIDFGLAKAIESETTPEAATIAASTDLGSIKGTAAYMSPEQTRGAKLDARSDIFSFGVVLYQMLSGRLPFQAPSYVDTLHAIVHDPTPPLTLAGTNAPVAERDDLQRILDKCLTKDPAARYQTARDLVVDLRDARRRLDSPLSSTVAGAAAPVAPESRWSATIPWLAAVIVAAAGLGYWWMHRAPAAPPPIAPGGRPSVAVLYFQNNTGSPQLDWLRTGLTDMVVTDLSQSPDMEVLGTDRLYQILSSLKRQNDAVISFDTVREVARLAGVQHVLVGNYVKAGDTIRINITLQEAESGRIVIADHLEAAGEANLFPTVDDLTRRLQTHFAGAVAMPTVAMAPPGASNRLTPTSSGLYRDLQEVTTSSIDAYRPYAQGVALLESGRPREAEPLLLQAIAVDPTFALAMARLAAAENNLRRLDKRAEYAKRALDHEDRLTPRDRYYLEGFYFSADEETAERGIAAFQKLLELYPQHYAGKHNLANSFDELEMYQDSVKLGEELRQNAFVLNISLTNLADSYASLDEFDKTMEVLNQLERQAPNSGYLHWRRGDMLMKFGKLEEARAEYDKAKAIDPDPTELSDEWALAVLQQRWSDAETIAARGAQSNDPFAKYAGVTGRALNQLYKGHSVAALETLTQATRTPGPWGETFDSLIQLMVARTDLALGQPAPALTAAQHARRTIGQNLLLPIAWSRFYMTLALNRLGRVDEAKVPMQELSKRAEVALGPRLKRMSQELAGALALDRHDAAGAVTALTAAEALLPPRGNWGPPPPQPELWFSLGSAYLAAGNDAEAEKRFLRLTSSVPRAMYPIEFVRSLFLLGQIAERRGDTAKAHEYYQQFLTYWSDGDIDRDHVADARKKLR